MAYATIIWAVKIREIRARNKKVLDVYKVVLQAAFINSLYNIFFLFINLFLGFFYKIDKL